MNSLEACYMALFIQQGEFPIARAHVKIKSKRYSGRKIMGSTGSTLSSWEDLAFFEYVNLCPHLYLFIPLQIAFSHNYYLVHGFSFAGEAIVDE